MAAGRPAEYTVLKGATDEMEKKTGFTVVGGDVRQIRLMRLLKENGFAVSAFAFDRIVPDDGIDVLLNLEDLRLARRVILPIPLEVEIGRLNSPLSNYHHSTADVLKNISHGTPVFCGMAKESVRLKAQEEGLRLFDYYKREEFQIRNAIPTAEGAMQIAMEEMETTLNGTACLVIGNGRIGKILASYLRGMGARVTVSARKYGDFAQIFASGNEYIHTGELDDRLFDFSVIFNTVPSMVLHRERLKKLRPDCLMIDLASPPGGIDCQAARELGLRALVSLSLPGKLSPMTAAAAIYDTVMNIMKEEELL